MISFNEPYNVGSSDSSVAMYRGVKVAVYSVDKTELHLTRNDLVELVNVSRCSLVDANYVKRENGIAEYIATRVKLEGGIPRDLRSGISCLRPKASNNRSCSSQLRSVTYLMRYTTLRSLYFSIFL